MRPIAERFADNRQDRFADLPHLRQHAAPRRAIACHPAMRSLWKAWRQDQRFALPRLYAAAQKHGLSTYYINRAAAALHAERFSQHADIPGHLFLFAAAHQSINNPARIACYPTRADAARCREIVMKPGVFFAACLPNATPAEIQRLSERFTCTACAPPVHFIPNTDPDGWARVYARARGFSSCMVGAWSASDPRHPARFYACPENDLALAFLTHDGDHDGDTVARCIVNTRNRAYVRVYGDARLLHALEAQGYQHDPEEALEGQTANAYAPDGRLVAPYIDGTANSVKWDYSSDTCVISAKGSIECTSTSGFACDFEEDDRRSCDGCGDPTDDDELIYSEYHDCHVCDYCCRHNYTYAYISARGNQADYVRDDEVIHIGSDAYLDDAGVLLGHGFVQDEDGDWQDADDCVFIPSRDAYVLLDNCTRLDIKHEGEEYAHTDDTRTITLDGETLTVHEDYDGPTDETRAAAANVRAAAIRASAIRRRQRANTRTRTQPRRARA